MALGTSHRDIAGNGPCNPGCDTPDAGSGIHERKEERQPMVRLTIVTVFLVGS